MLTARQHAELAERGHTRLRGAFDRACIDPVAERVWSYLEAHRGVRRDDPSTWDLEAPWGGLKDLRREEPYLSLASPALEAALDALLGQGAWRARDWGGFLVSFPGCAPAEWRLPARGWHVDAHFTHDPERLFGLRVFTFLTSVVPRGGGTLVVRGSHRLVQRYVAAMTPEERQAGYARLKRRLLASDPWLAELSGGDAGDPERTRRLLGATRVVDGVELAVEELQGEPGDVVLAHPWFVHVTAPHAGRAPRFVLAKDVVAVTPRVQAGPA